MSIASEILRIQQAKEAIKESINDKGGTLTNESIDDYAQAIDNLPSGDITYEDYARTFYLALGKLNQFATAWEHSLTVVTVNKNNYPNGETEGVIIPHGVTNAGSFYGWTSNNQPLVIPNSVTRIGAQAFDSWTSNNQPLIIPRSVKDIWRQAFYDWTSNNQPLVIPNSVTYIESQAFYGWSSNNQPLVISNGVTSIAYNTFYGWTSNNQPLIIPNSVTRINSNAFQNWTSNNQPLIIPQSVTSIGAYAFSGWSLVPYVEMKRTTPPTLVNANAFGGQNDAPIYVPDESVDDYKTATNWVNLASRIFSINDK